MYLFEVNILYYVLAIIISTIIGQYIDYCAKTFGKGEKILSKNNFKRYKETFKLNYILIIILSVLNIFLIQKFKIRKEFFLNLDLIKYSILIPALICIFIVDIKKKIIPNRLNLCLFELGLIIVFIYGTYKESLAIEYIYASILNLGIFLIITLMSAIFLGKEGIGFGDVKLMSILGLFIGVTNSINVFILSFIIGGIISIYAMLARGKKIDSYIPFATCIVIATIITIFFPINILAILGNLII